MGHAELLYKASARARHKLAFGLLWTAAAPRLPESQGKRSNCNGSFSRESSRPVAVGVAERRSSQTAAEVAGAQA